MATIKIEIDHNPFVKNSNVFSYKKDINKWIYLELYHKIILYHKINLLNFYMLTWPLRLFFHNFIPERCTRLFVFLFYKIQYYFKFKEYINAYKVIFRFVSMFFKLINHGLDYIEILKKKMIQDSNLRYMIHWWKKNPYYPYLSKF